MITRPAANSCSGSPQRRCCGCSGRVGTGSFARLRTS
jgi:hypothetical protein